MYYWYSFFACLPFAANDCAVYISYAGSLSGAAAVYRAYGVSALVDAFVCEFVATVHCPGSLTRPPEVSFEGVRYCSSTVARTTSDTMPCDLVDFRESARLRCYAMEAFPIIARALLHVTTVLP